MLSINQSIIVPGGVINVRSHSQRFVTSFMWLNVLVLATGYVGNLVSFLSVTVTPMPFQSVEEMVEVGTHTWGAEEGAMYDTIMVSMAAE